MYLPKGGRVSLIIFETKPTQLLTVLQISFAEKVYEKV